MRRLLLVVCAVALVDTMLYAVLTPLLPKIVHDLHLGKGSAGILVAGFALGSLAGAVPAGWVSTRLGSKVAVVLGMTSLAVASLAFATAGSLSTLMAARFVQGASSALSWSGGIGWLLSAAPQERRGQLLGVALGAGIFGGAFGPVLGSLAALTSRSVVFTGVAALASATALWSLRLRYSHDRTPSPGALRRAGQNPGFLAGLAMMVVPAFLVGVVLVLGPLHLSSRGWGAAAVGAVWLLTALLQSAASPVLGRMSDQRGARVPIVLLFVLGIPLSVALAIVGAPVLYAVLLVAASTTYGGLYSPAFALIARGAHDSGLPQGLAFAAMQASWAVGAVIGPATGGAVAQATGDRVPLLVCAGICAAALVYARARPRVGAYQPGLL